MSADAGLIERMGNAVRAAYKAMEILKEENRQLKIENETLKKKLANSEQLGSCTKTTSGVAAVVALEDNVYDREEDTFVEKQSALAPPQVASVHKPNVSPFIISKHLPAVPSPAPIPAHETKATVAATSKHAIVKAIPEIGLSKFSFRNFANAPDANQFVKHLTYLTRDNVHFIAKTLSGQSLETLCKALVLTVRGFVNNCTDDVLGPDQWHEDVNSSSSNNKNITLSFSNLIPHCVLEKLDILVTMLVSMGSRQDKGILSIAKLTRILEKVILGAVRFQLSSPHYAVVNGVLNSERNVIAVPERHLAGTSYTNDCASNKVEKTMSGSTNGTVVNQMVNCDHDQQEVKASTKKQGRDELAALFGIESGSDDDDEWMQAEEVEHKIISDTAAKPTNPSKVSTSEDMNVTEDMHGQQYLLDDEMSVDSDNIQHNHPHRESEDENSYTGDAGDDDGSDRDSLDAQDIDDDVYNTLFPSEERVSHTEVDAQVNNEEDKQLKDVAQKASPSKRKYVDSLDLACRVHILLSTLVRLRLYAELSKTLHHLAYISYDNLNEGCILGVISVFGSPRYDNVAKNREIRQPLRRVVQEWYDIIMQDKSSAKLLSSQHNQIGSIPPAALQSLLQDFWKCCLCCGKNDLLTGTSTISLHSEESELSITHRSARSERAVRVLRRAVSPISTSENNGVAVHVNCESDWDSLCACRGLGFWPAALLLSGASFPTDALHPINSSNNSNNSSNNNRNDNSNNSNNNNKNNNSSVLVSLGSIGQIDPFALIGLDKIGDQATQWIELLNFWNPGKPMSDYLKGHIPSVSAFFKSSSFNVSNVQEHAFTALQLANISPFKYFAQDAVVEIFTEMWGKCELFDPSKCTDLTRAMRLLRVLLASSFETEYEAYEGGWRSGLGGGGFRLESRLENRVTVGRALLRRIPFASHFISSALSAPLKPALYWQHMSSCTGRKLLEYAEFVDHCMTEVFQRDLASREPAGAIPTAQEIAEKEEISKSIAKLCDVCCEIVSLLALVGVENTAGVVVGSLRGLLRATTKAVKQSNTTSSACLFSVVEEVHKLLTTIPAPWGGVCHADILCELWKCTTTALAATTGTSSSSVSFISHIPSITPQEKSLRLRIARHELHAAGLSPVFMISLDKRCDRYRRSLIMMEQTNMPIIRVRAWDGTGDTASTSAAEMFQKKFSASSAFNATASNSNSGAHLASIFSTISTTSAAELAELFESRKEDDYMDIPESDVKLTWDSTVNALFDSCCKPNKAVIATASERACAASHLKVWRYIAAVCGIKRAGNTGSRHSAAARAAADATIDQRNSQNLENSPADIYKALKNGVVLAQDPIESANTAHSSTQSHHNVYNTLTHRVDAISRSDEYFIVLEDDVCFPQQTLQNLRSTIDHLMHTLPKDVDILYLGGLLPKASSHFKMKSVKPSFFSVNYMWTLQAYVLRRRAVEVLLSKVPICAPVDNFVASLIYGKELKAFIVKGKLTQRIAPASSGLLKGKKDSDVRPSGRTYEFNLKSSAFTSPSRQSSSAGGGGNRATGRKNMNNGKSSNSAKRKRSEDNTYSDLIE